MVGHHHPRTNKDGHDPEYKEPLLLFEKENIEIYLMNIVPKRISNRSKMLIIKTKVINPPMIQCPKAEYCTHSAVV